MKPRSLACLILAASVVVSLPESSMAQMANLPVQVSARISKNDDREERAREKDKSPPRKAKRLSVGQEITLTNTGTADLDALEVRYRVYGYTLFGENGKPEGEMAFTEGKSTVAALKMRQREKIQTKPIEVAGNKDISERDVAKGIWVRVIDKSGKEVGTLISPPMLAKKFEWKE